MKSLMLSLVLGASVAGASGLTWELKDGKRLSGHIYDVNKQGLVLVDLSDPKAKRTATALTALSAGARKKAETWAKKNAAPKGFGSAQKTILISTVPQKMLYDVTAFKVAPNQAVRLLFINRDEMAHNLLICQKGDAKLGMAVAQAAWALGDKGLDMGYIPKHDKLFVNTALLLQNESQSVFFKAPAKTGAYPYVCSVPGHAALMKGTMTVGSGSLLSGLTFKSYAYKGDKVPDFTTMKVLREGPLKSGKISTKTAGVKPGTAVLYEGTVTIPVEGNYTFHLSSDDGSQLVIDGKTVVDNDGVHADTMKKGAVELTKGPHALKVGYFDKSGQHSLSLALSGPGMKRPLPLSDTARSGGRRKRPSVSIPIEPTETEAVMYRNFISGAGVRAIGVGLPGGVNVAWDADNMRLALAWTGAFMSGGKHWVGRGSGSQPPEGDRVVTFVDEVPFAVLDDVAVTTWPRTDFRAKSTMRTQPFIFKGYMLNEQRIPTFRYEFHGLEVTDTFVPAVKGEEKGIRRTIVVSGKKPPGTLCFLLARGDLTEAGGGYQLAGTELTMTLAGCKPLLRKVGDTTELIVPIEFEGDNATIEQVLTWK